MRFLKSLPPGRAVQNKLRDPIAAERLTASQTPLLSKGGEDATSIKYRAASLLGADGREARARQREALRVVGSSTKTNLFELEPTTPSARAKVASRNFLDRAATPPLLRRGVWIGWSRKPHLRSCSTVLSHGWRGFAPIPFRNLDSSASRGGE